MSLRWIYQARQLPNDRIDFGEDLTFTTEREQQEADHYNFEGEINAELKKAKKSKVPSKKMLKGTEKEPQSCSTRF